MDEAQFKYHAVRATPDLFECVLEKSCKIVNVRRTCAIRGRLSQTAQTIVTCARKYASGLKMQVPCKQTT
jgi:hypothetical protein